jgi:hypothetical protein
MNKITQTNLDNLRSANRELQNSAFIHILKVSDLSSSSKKNS